MLSQLRQMICPHPEEVEEYPESESDEEDVDTGDESGNESTEEVKTTCPAPAF